MLRNDDRETHAKPQKKAMPWKNIQISKADRKGKTPKQIQELRKELWLEQNKDRVELGELTEDEIMVLRLVGDCKKEEL